MVSQSGPRSKTRTITNAQLPRLLNYTPQGKASAVLQVIVTPLILSATLVRLLTINSMNAYITSWVLYLSGGSEDPRLLLPAWISIATVSYDPQRNSLVSNAAVDSDLLIPYYASQVSDPERDFSFHFRVFHSKLHKHGQSASAIAPDEGE